MSKKIKPTFNKEFPKDAYKYFSIESDYEFKEQHPIGYRILVCIGIFAIVLPLILYLIFVSAIFPAPNSSWLILGFVGAFTIGVGLFNIVAAYINQYLGHMVTLMCLFGGMIFIVFSCIMLYT